MVAVHNPAHDVILKPVVSEKVTQLLIVVSTLS